MHVLAEAYVKFRAMTGDTAVRLEAAGYTAPDQQAYLNDVRRILAGAGLADEFSYRGVVDRDGKLAFLKGPRPPVGSGNLRRAERNVPARGHGERSTCRSAPQGRLRRDHREDRRGAPGGPRRHRQPCARPVHAVAGPGEDRQTWASAPSARFENITPSRIRHPACSTSMTMSSRAVPNLRTRMP